MSVKAVYRNGVFKPLCRVDLPEETEVELQVLQCPDPKQQPAAPSTAGPQQREPLRDESGKVLSLGLATPPPPDFKELGPEWQAYTG